LFASAVEKLVTTVYTGDELVTQGKITTHLLTPLFIYFLLNPILSPFVRAVKAFPTKEFLYIYPFIISLLEVLVEKGVDSPDIFFT
jgi:hypothetical protein